MRFWRETLIAALVASLALAGAFIKHQSGQIADQKAALKTAAEALHKAADAIRDRDDALTANAAQEASDATQTATFYRGAARDAFQAGYASHPRCAGEPAPVGVQSDLRALWSAGSIPGSPGVSGKPSR
ncbi:hypothetical protein [Phenylobacterium sp.]|uniref:hypothetical protein n=1 Tax=Phenylobacterium sp. TaxID=1871053 RepID=UPI0030F3F4B8